MAIDWSSIYKKYKGLWVALKSDEKTVISSAKTPFLAHQIAKKKGEESPILTLIPRNLTPIVG